MTSPLGDTSPSDTSKNKIYRNVRRSIISNDLKPGERLHLDELAAQYNTSVTPVREALQMLTQENLVVNRPHAGFYVAKVSLNKLRDMLELRKILELASVEQAAQRITEEQLSILENLHAGYTGDDNSSQERYLDENLRFHYLIAQASGNQELAETLKRLHERLARFLIFIQTGDEIENRHHRLVEALRAGDIESAKQAILDEVNETRQITLEHIIREDSDAWYVGTRPE